MQTDKAVAIVVLWQHHQTYTSVGKTHPHHEFEKKFHLVRVVVRIHRQEKLFKLVLMNGTLVGNASPTKLIRWKLATDLVFDIQTVKCGQQRFAFPHAIFDNLQQGNQQIRSKPENRHLLLAIFLEGFKNYRYWNRN